jgi:HEAT repeat protein
MTEVQRKTRYLEVLGLSGEAGLRDVQSAFRRLVLKYHPDVNRSAGAANLFRDITEAYNGLLDMLTAAEARSGGRVSAGVRKDPLVGRMGLEELEERFRYSVSPQVRRCAVMAMGLHGGSEAKRLLLQAIKDPDPDVQSTALSALGDLCGVKDAGRIIISMVHVRRMDNIPSFLRAAVKALRATAPGARGEFAD